MEYLLVIAVLAGLAYMIVRAGRSRVDPDSSTLSATDYRVSRTPPDPNDDFYWLSNDILKVNATFIEERWNRALKGQEAGTLIDSKEFPNWYFESRPNRR
jgi:hypothetical protein